MTDIKHMELFNTETKAIEKFVPIDEKKVRLYTCGPTVYSYQHVGNLRTYVFADVLKRTLQAKGYRVLQAMNITDVGHLTGDADVGDDKVEAAAEKAGKDAWIMTEEFKTKFLDDCSALRILPPDIICRATDHIDEQIEVIKKLEAKGLTYSTDDGLYFDTASFTPVTSLKHMQIAASDDHSRIGTSRKKSGADFALWKFSSPGENRQMEWASPWGTGFPGWHIECSAMSMKYLGITFDIHTGGIDHIPVHHTNEIFQSEAVTGTRFVNYWVHGGWLSVGESGKMSKSEGKTILLDELVARGYDPLAFRYLTLTTHYRGPLKFTWDALHSADIALKRLRAVAGAADSANGKVSDVYATKFLNAMASDLNAPAALAVLWELVKNKNLSPEDKSASIFYMDRILGIRAMHGSPPSNAAIDVPALVLSLVQERQSAKSDSDYLRADELRQEVNALGFEITDTPDGPKLTSKE